MISAYSRLLQVEKSFRMSKTDLAARPIYHHTRESIEAHLTIVFAALAAVRVGPSITALSEHVALSLSMYRWLLHHVRRQHVCHFSFRENV